MESASNSPVVIYVTIAVGVLVIISMAVPKIMGPLGTAFSDWTKQRRRVSTETDDARVADMQVDISYLKAELISLRAEMRSRNELIRVHEEWDRELIRAYLDSIPGANIPTPPKLDFP